MLPHSSRLRARKELDAVWRSRRVFRDSLLTLRVIDRHDADPARVAIAVSQRVGRRAVDRHEITRWIREAVHAELPDLRPGTNLLFAASGSLSQYSYRACLGSVHALLMRSGITKER